jgi:chromatin remodeling complex protein RSC6
MSAPGKVGPYEGPEKSSLIENKLLSKEMYRYLDMEESTPISCKTFLNLFWNRVKSDCLINPKDRREILPDEKLRNLLKIDTSTKVTMYNMHLFLSHHVLREIEFQI